jgi:hypothetical protein
MHVGLVPSRPPPSGAATVPGCTRGVQTTWPDLATWTLPSQVWRSDLAESGQVAHAEAPGMTPHVKPLRSSYMGLHPQTGVT